MTQRIADNPGIPRHREEIDFFLALLMDMAKMIAGDPRKPITIARLEEGARMLRRLEGCRGPERQSDRRFTNG